MNRRMLRRLAALLALCLLGSVLTCAIAEEAPDLAEETLLPAEPLEPSGDAGPGATIAPAPKEGLEVYYFDLERVDGILIRCDGATCFIDVGYRRDAQAVLGYLEGLGVEKLDCYIGTHGHADHIDGAPPLIASLRPDVIYVPHRKVFATIRASARADEREAVAAARCQVLRHGDSFRIGGAEVSCLGPVHTVKCTVGSIQENYNSLVLKLTYGERSFLFTGDTSDGVLSQCEKAHPGQLKCDVFKNPHHNGVHGDYILSLIQPAITVFCTDNDSLPRPAYLKKLRALGSETYVTCSKRDGNVLVTSDGKDLKVLRGYPLTTLALDPVDSTLLPGDRLFLTGSAEPSERFDPRWLAWESSDPGVVAVREGEIGAISEGEATITATAINGLSASVDVRVIATGILLEYSEMIVGLGQEEVLRAKLTGAGGDASQIVWRSEDETVAIVSGEGEIIGMRTGVTRIVATLPNGAEAACDVYVTEIPVDELTLNKRKLTMKVGKVEYLAVQFIPSNATDRTLEWASSDESVVTVDALGYVTAVGPGKAKVGVRAASGAYAVCNVVVK